jgi:diguanylate cyclase (GGDEF)-like protein
MSIERPPPERGASDVAAMLETIWERHRGDVLERIEVLERTALALVRGDLDGDLHDEARACAHRLAGSLGTFGLAAASERARQIERTLDDHEPLHPAQAPGLARLVVAIRDEVQAATGGAERSTGVRHVSDSDDEAPPLLLIVEDDGALAERYAAEAGRSGIQVAVATSPADARAAVASRRPDAVLLDLMFADGSGDAYSLLSELTGATPPVPVLVSTVRDEFTDRVEVARRGGRGFVTKTMPPGDVIDEVVQLLGRTRTTGATVLAVDDDPQLLDGLRAMLAADGFQVRTLADPLRFWSALEQTRPDLVLLDVEMPQVSGIDLCRVLRNDPRWATVPVLILTARRDSATIERVFAAGADDYLTKPVLAAELLVRLHNRAERLLQHRALAETDSLTGVANRQAATHGVERLLRLAGRHERPMSLALLDLDRFKAVNDRHGHAAGDTVLRRFGKLLTQRFRGEDVVGRWGGEEFVVGMYGMSAADAVARLTDLLATLSGEPFAGTAGSVFHVGFSAGVARFPHDGRELQALLAAADDALYRAKDLGRGMIAVPGSAA